LPSPFTIHVDRIDLGDDVPGGNVRLRLERPVAIAEKHADRISVGFIDDEVEHAIAVDVDEFKILSTRRGVDRSLRESPVAVVLPDRHTAVEGGGNEVGITIARDVADRHIAGIGPIGIGRLVQTRSARVRHEYLLARQRLRASSRQF
jgi:hypothetical protein